MLVAAVLASLSAFRYSRASAPYVPTPDDVVDRMLALAGRPGTTWSTTWAAATAGFPSPRPGNYGARGVGIDIDPRRIEESRANAKAAGVEQLVEFRLEDALKADVSQATVVTLYHAGVGKREAAAGPDAPAPARRPHRLPRLQHGPDWPADKIDQFVERPGRRGHAVSVESRRQVRA